MLMINDKQNAILTKHLLEVENNVNLSLQPNKLFCSFWPLVIRRSQGFAALPAQNK